MFLGLFSASLSQRPILLVPEPMAGCRGILVLPEQSCRLMGLGQAVDQARGCRWGDDGSRLAWSSQSLWKSSSVTMQWISPCRAGDPVGARNDAMEDGRPSSTSSTAVLMISSLANPDGQHWPPRNPRPCWVDNSIREMAAGSEYQPQPRPYQEGFQTPKTSHQRHTLLKSRRWRRHANKPGQGGHVFGEGQASGSVARQRWAGSSASPCFAPSDKLVEQLAWGQQLR